MKRERKSDPAKEFLMQAATGMQCHYKIINTITNGFIFTDEKKLIAQYLNNEIFKIYIRDEISTWREVI